MSVGWRVSLKADVRVVEKVAKWAAHSVEKLVAQTVAKTAVSSECTRVVLKAVLTVDKRAV